MLIVILLLHLDLHAFNAVGFNINKKVKKVRSQWENCQFPDG